ncbi:MAG: tape measure protein, partial [Polynucleobacter sp.]
MAAQDVNIKLRAVDETKAAFTSVEKSLGGLNSAFMNVAKVAGTLFTAATFKSVLDSADAYTMMMTRLKLVSTSTEEYKNAQKSLIDISKETNSDLDATVGLYEKLTRGVAAAGIAQENVLPIVRGINQALAISGATGASATAALVQLQQGFASGVLRGEEFNSVAEQAPMILTVLGNGLNKSAGELRKFANDGQLTTEMFVKGFLKGAADLQKQFDQIPATFTAAMQNLRVGLQVASGNFEELTGISEKAAFGIKYIADAIVDMGKTAIVADVVTAVFETIAVLIMSVVYAAKLAVIELNYIYESIKAIVNLDLNKLPDILKESVIAAKQASDQYQKSTSSLINFKKEADEVKDPFEAIQNKNIFNYFESVKDRAERLNKSIAAVFAATDMQKTKYFSDQMNILDRLYKNGAIGIEIYTQAKKKLSDAFQTDASKARIAADSLGYYAENVQAVAAAVTGSDYAKAQQFSDKLAILDDMFFNAGLSAEAYDSALKSLANTSTVRGADATQALRDYAMAAQDVGKQMVNLQLGAIRSLEDSFVNLINGTMSVKEAFSSMANSIISDLTRMWVQKSITGPIAQALGISGATGKAVGGSVQAGQPYMVGERGPEMFVPSQSGSIVSNGDMAGGGGVTVNQTINVTTGVQQTVRAEIMGLMPQ